MNRGRSLVRTLSTAVPNNKAVVKSKLDKLLGQVL